MFAAYVVGAAVVLEVGAIADLAIKVCAVVTALAAPDCPGIALKMEHIAPVVGEEASRGPLPDRLPALLCRGRVVRAMR